jgi:hypothetical protein
MIFFDLVIAFDLGRADYTEKKRAVYAKLLAGVGSVSESCTPGRKVAMLLRFSFATWRLCAKKIEKNE